MSNIIFNIYTRVNSKLAPNSNETMDAMMVAAEIMNEQHSEEELAEIREFTKKLEPQHYPGFKSLYDEETSAKIWQVVGWVVRTHTLLNHVRDLLGIYTHMSSPNFNIEYTEDGKWLIKSFNSTENRELRRELDFFYGMNLIKEIIEFADETL